MAKTKTEWKRYLQKQHIRPVFDDDGTWDGLTYAYTNWGHDGEARFDPADPEDALLIDLIRELIEGGKWKRLRKRREEKSEYQCAFPGCEELITCFHHITYRPVSGCRLCSAHHREITIINCNAVEKTRRKLSNKYRWFLFTRWKKGELKPMMTEHAERYMSSFVD